MAFRVRSGVGAEVTSLMPTSLAPKNLPLARCSQTLGLMGRKPIAVSCALGLKSSMFEDALLPTILDRTKRAAAIPVVIRFVNYNIRLMSCPVRCRTAAEASLRGASGHL